MSHEIANAFSPARPYRQRAFFLTVAIAITFISLITAFQTGIARGFRDSVGLASWGRLIFAVGATLTYEHGGYGYTIASVIETVLTSGGLTNDPKILEPLATKFPDNLRDTKLINSAIDKAAQFKWPFNPNENVRGSGGDDLGLVDFVRLGFFLFGNRLQSLYYTYFVVLTISILGFVYAFRRHLVPLALLAVTCIAHALLFSSSIFDRSTLGTIIDPRFLSALAIVPGLHIACLVATRAAPTPANAGIALIQTVILIFALWIRASAVWVILALSIFAIAALSHRRRIPRIAEIWGVAVLFAVLMLRLIYISFALHPVYGQKGEISHHVFWHAVFYQLQFNPMWKQKYAAQYDNATYDELPPIAAKKYLLRHPPADPDSVYLTRDHNYLRIAALETYSRRAFFEFFRNDPQFVLETFLLYSPLRMFNILAPVSEVRPDGSRKSGLMMSLGRLGAPAWLAIGGALLLLGSFLRQDPEDFRFFANATAVSVCAFFVSLVPIVVTAPDYATMADQYYVLLIVFGCLAVVILGWAARVATRVIMRN